MTIDTSIEIAKIESWHLRFEGGYWEQFDRGADGAPRPRFEFHPGWQTVYAADEEAILIRVTLVDGNQGWGETNCSVGPEVIGLILSNLVSEMVVGREFESPRHLWDFLYDAQRGRGYHSGFWLDALAGLDIALFDAVGRRNQLPAHQLLGPPVRDSLPIYLSGILRPTIEGRIAHANEWIDNGLQGTKLFLTPDLDECLKEIQALQTGCPDMQRWMVDMSWMLSLDVAITAKQAFHDANVEFLECPLQPEDLAGHRRLWKEQGTPIALGEHFRTAYQLVDWLNGDRALDVYQPDVGHTGFSDGVRQLGMAWESNLEATIHMSGSAVLQAATFTLSSICRPTHLQEYMPRMTEKMSDAIDSGWVYRNGEIPVSDRPGLGVDVFPDKLAPFVVR